MIEIGLLGPVQVVADRSAVAIRGRLELALLTRLALDPGRVITAERLIADLWGDRPPSHPIASLQTLVYRLRRSLGADAELVSWASNGYRLTVPSDHVDVGRFERMLDEARNASNFRSLDETRVLLRDALDIWRGPPLGGLEGLPFTERHAGRLTARRLAVLEECVAADLEAGQHVAAASELEQLVDEFPFQERFWAQLMTALYRSGSQTGSLRACSRLRKLLAEQLGLEPSPMIQDLENAILMHSPDLDWRPSRDRPIDLRADRAGTNLPYSIDEFIGRTAELERANELLTHHRLISLVGPGGSGKTRLAVEVARSLLDEFDSGVWFVDLSLVTDKTGALKAIASMLGVSPISGRSLDRQLADEISGRRLLLVVDNCEHIVEVAAGVIAQLLHHSEGVRVLATSRQPLGVAGETTVSVAALSLPSREHPQRVLESDAVRLFLSRGRAASPAFVASDDDLGHVAEIALLVDGLPLALELAAARLRVVSVAELVELLRDRLDVLGSGNGGDRDRHRTVEALVDWSYRLLEPDAQLVLGRLAVFAGGFTLQSAEKVTGGGALPPAAVIPRLIELVDKSLVQRVDTPDGSRYRLLEIVREFAARRLTSSGEADTVRDRHLAWALELTGDLEAAIRTDAQDRALAAVVVDHDNLRAARDWGRARADTVSVLRITTVAPIDSNFEREPLLTRMLGDITDASLSLQARARYTCVSVAFDRGDYETGARHGQAAVSLFHQLEDPLQEGYALMMTAFCRWGQGRPDVGDQLGRAAVIFEALDDTMARAYISWTLSQWHLHNGHDWADVEALAERGVDLFTSIRAEFGLAHAREGLAYVRLRTGDRGPALRLIIDAMTGLQSTEHHGCLAHTVDAAAVWAADGGHLEEAARLVGAAESMLQRSGGVRRPWELVAYDRLIRRLSAEMTPDRLGRVRREGRDLTPDRTIDHVRQFVV